MPDVLLMAAGQFSNPVLLFVLVEADYRSRERICEGTIRCPDRSLRKVRRLRPPFRENVDYCFAGSNEVVGNDAAMTSPPNRFSAHDGALSRMSDLAKPSQTSLKFVAHGVVSIIVEALVLPEAVDRRRNGAVVAQASQLRNVRIVKFERAQRPGKNIAIELGVLA